MLAVAAGLAVTSLTVVSGSIYLFFSGSPFHISIGVLGTLVGLLLGFTAVIAFRGETGVRSLINKRDELEKRNNSL